jgi:hypothetical protein
MEKNKHHTPFGIIIILFVIIVAAIFLVKGDAGKTPPLTNNTPINSTPIFQPAPYKCGMTVTAPLPNMAVAFPLNVSGVVHNDAATDGCTWIQFEGQAGTVSISNGATTYALTPVMLMGDWMTSGPVNFTAVLSPMTIIPSGTPLTITFTEENPSGEGIIDSFSYQVIAQ